MIPLLPVLWFIVLVVFAIIIIKKYKKPKFIVFGILGFSLLLELISILTMNKAIDIIDFGNNHSGANTWIFVSISCFFLGIILMLMLNFGRKYFDKMRPKPGS